MKRPRHLSSGGILVVALVIILVVGAVTAGWLTIMTTEMAYADQFSTASQRRIALGNTTALARQYLLASVLTKGSSAAATADVGGGWGSVEIPATSAPALSTFQKAAGYNHFNPGNGDGYTEDITVSMTVGTVSTSRLLQIKSRSSLLSGTLAVWNQPGNAVGGTLVCNGQALLWVPQGDYSTMAASSYAVPSEPGGNILPSNFPFVPLTGSEIGGAPAYDGSLNVIANTSTINSLAVMAITSAPSGVQNVTGTVAQSVNGVTCDGVGNVVIDLREPTLGNVVITGAVTHLTLTGQAAGSADASVADTAAAILILVNQTLPATDLVQVTCTNSNERKLVLAIKSSTGNPTPFDFSQAGSGDWRILITLENTSATFNLHNATQTLSGGIQSNGTITVSSGALSISPEQSPKLLERLADRDGWIEAYTP